MAKLAPAAHVHGMGPPNSDLVFLCLRNPAREIHSSHTTCDPSRGWRRCIQGARVPCPQRYAPPWPAGSWRKQWGTTPCDGHPQLGVFSQGGRDGLHRGRGPCHHRFLGLWNSTTWEEGWTLCPYQMKASDLLAMMVLPSLDKGRRPG